VRQALGLPGTARPGWQVLAELCDLLGADAGAGSSPEVTALIADAVPFYAGLTLDEVGGDGVRWQDREAASAAPADELPTTELEQPRSLPDGLVLGSAPTLWTGPPVEHSPSLRFLDTAPRLLVSPADARELGVENGDEVEVEANGDGTGATVVIRTGVPSGSVFLSPPALAEGPVRIRAREAVAG